MLPSGKLHLQFIEVFLQLAVQMPDFQSILQPLYHTQGTWTTLGFAWSFYTFLGKVTKEPILETGITASQRGSRSSIPVTSFYR